MKIDEIHQELAKQGKIAIIWSIEDVQTVRENLNDDEAMEVLQEAKHRHDAGHGITWDTLEEIADELFPDNQERESESGDE